MILTLEVIGEQARELGASGRKEFHSVGGTIGRLPDNDWVFPDPYISGRHALIRFLNGRYFIEDTSTNGVFINAPGNRVSRTQPQQLRHGDRLYIDAYQIQVSIGKDPAADKRRDPFGGLKAGSSRPAPRPSAAVAPQEDRTASLVMDVRGEGADDDDDNGTEWFGMSEMSAPVSGRKAPAQAPQGRSRPEAPQPAAVVSATPPGKALPPARPDSSAGADRRSASVPDENSHLQVLLAAAGIEGLHPSSHVAQTLGEVLRLAVGGVMDVLRARERMKDELRMRGTSFKAAHNNPLKFSANVDDAFHNLLVKHNPAYLEPAGSVQDAFRDVSDHHSAFLAAMRLAFESMLAQFDPERLQEDFDRQMKKGAILGVPAKLRYWDLYRERYDAQVRDAEAAFRNLFADEFARAYEEHIERLQAAGRGRGG